MICLIFITQLDQKLIPNKEKASQWEAFSYHQTRKESEGKRLMILLADPFRFERKSHGFGGRCFTNYNYRPIQLGATGRMCACDGENSR